VGEELDELDPDPPEDEPEEAGAAGADFSVVLAAGVESDFDSDLAALFSAESELDLPSERESFR
jgi:hypothetical protein